MFTFIRNIATQQPVLTARYLIDFFLPYFNTKNSSDVSLVERFKRFLGFLQLFVTSSMIFVIVLRICCDFLCFFMSCCVFAMFSPSAQDSSL